MYATLYTLLPSSPLVDVARRFTPRFERVGPLVVIDAGGLGRIFGSPMELGRHLHAEAWAQVPGVRVAVAATQAAAALAVLGRPGVTLVPAGEEAARLAMLPVGVLREYERVRGEVSGGEASRGETERNPPLAIPDSRLATPDARHPAPDPRMPAGGWRHPRDTHQAQQTRAPRRAAGSARVRAAQAAIDEALAVLQRWGVRTLGALAALPAADLSERLGPRGPRWQRLARGEDHRPLVPWVDEPPCEASLDLDWPIDGLEPLSFVLGRLLEPLAARLEREARGAAVLAVRLQLVTREAHTRVLQLPAPMRDAKTLRTLLRLDLERHPPPAAIDRVTVAIEPAPRRVTQDVLFARAAPPPEQVATLLARLTALVGEGHVGTPVVPDTWRPGAFGIHARFTVHRPPPDAAMVPGRSRSRGTAAAEAGVVVSGVVRRYRLPVPVRVRIDDGRPVRVMSDRHGIPGGAIVQATGPWRASGWPAVVGPPAGSGDEDAGRRWPGTGSDAWDRDEWDVELAGGIVYRLFVERTVGQWFIEGVID
jgi:protein ImuB